MKFSVVAFSLAAQTNISATERYASKTAYRAARAPWGRPIEDTIDPKSIVHVDILFRHGVRYPKTSQIIKWQHTAQSLIPAYVPRMNASNGYLLSPIGWHEMEDLGKKWAAMARHIGAPTFSASSKSRTMASAEAFIHGYYDTNWTKRTFGRMEGVVGKSVGSSGYVDVQGHRIIAHDEMLRFFDYDAQYQREVSENAAALKEKDAFERGEEMRRMAEDVSNQIGRNVSVAQSIELWSLTGFEVALFNASTLSSLWTTSQEVLNYAADLKHFYKSGRGHKASVYQAQPYVRRLLRHLSSFGQYYAFGHAETLIPVLELIARRGFEEVLTASNYRAQRSFDSSNIAPFGANFAVVVTSSQEVRLVLNGHVYGETYSLEAFTTLLAQLSVSREEL